MRGGLRPEKHFGLEAAAWYWHFVDVVWLFLFAYDLDDTPFHAYHHYCLSFSITPHARHYVQSPMGQ